MRYRWQYPSILLASELAAAQRVLQGSVQHFQSDAAGPWQPLMALGFGTPPQEITGIFDTGSSDTIIPQAGSALCQVPNQQCAPPAPVVRGQFDGALASDVEVLAGKKFNASFSGGDEFDGEFIKTTVSVGDKGKVPGAQVALASGGQPAGDFPQFSIYGVGPAENEATDEKYDNLPQVMKDAGVIKGNSYSVFLNPTPLANGSVFFGGIDRSKFTGELQQVAIDRTNDGKIADFVVKMSSVMLDMSGGAGNQTAKLSKDQKRARLSLKRSILRRAIRERPYSKARGKYGSGQADMASAAAVDDEAVSALSSGEKGQNRNNSNGNGDGNNDGNCSCNGNGNNRGNNNKNKNNGDDNNINKNNGNKNNDNNNNGDRNGDKNNGDDNNRNKNNGNKNNDNKNKNGDNKKNGDKNNGNNNANLVTLGRLEGQEVFTLFDTGGVDLSLPEGVVRKMAEALDTDFSREDGLGAIDCGKLNAGNKLVLGFNDDKVKMTLSLDKVRLSEEQTDPALTRAGLCFLGARAADPDDGLNSIGYPFFTDVYTVFDLENNSLWFAQGKGDPSAPAGQLEEFP